MLYQMIGGHYSFAEILFLFFGYVVLILIMMPVHEFAHAYAAYKMGDQTALYNGRLTLNPFAHIDPIGAALIFIFGFGYAKPVPVNSYNFRNRRLGMAVTSFAGPFSNLLMAVLSMALLGILWRIDGGIAVGGAYTSWFPYVYLVLFQVFVIRNIALAVFNLLPIPPMDGFRIVSAALPYRWTYWVDRYFWYIQGGLMLLLFSGILTGPLMRLIIWITDGLCRLFGIPFM